MAKFSFDPALCIGCRACELACKQWHGIETDGPWGRELVCEEQGSFPDVERSFVSRATKRCDLCRSAGAAPRCARTCPTGALRFE